MWRIALCDTRRLESAPMLTHLALKDFAVVQSAELAFGPGLTVISGETGAGKSLLVDALGLLAGLRADSGVVRHGASRAELVADFSLADAEGRRRLVARQRPGRATGTAARIARFGASCAPMAVRAPGSTAARSRSAQLAELASHLVEIHGQHEHQALLSRASQLALLDAYARNEPERRAVAEAASRWSALLAEREHLTAQGDVSDRIGWLEHQHAELDRETLEPESLAQLQADHRRSAHAAGLMEACDRAFATMDGEEGPSLTRALQQARDTLQRVAEHEPRLVEVDAMLDNAAIQLDEAAVLLDRIRSDLDLDPQALDEPWTQRLSRLHELARKHRVTPDQLAGKRDDDRHRTRPPARRGRAPAGAGCRNRRCDARLAEGGRGAWHDPPRGRPPPVVGHVRPDCRARHGRRRVRGRAGAAGCGRPDPQGAERVEFMVAANPGQPPRPLRKVASGGELSRISLAIEVAALGLDAVPTMVFDEVDSGIGGAVADIVGQKLRALGERRQVLCVTHLPQVAAQGHAHYRVSKSASDGVTQSEVQALGAKQRQDELARMLGGVEMTREARAAARRLLSDAG